MILVTLLYVVNIKITFLKIQIKWGAESMESLSCLASRLATSSNKAKVAVPNSLYGRLNLNLVKANVTAMLSRCFA